MSNSPLVTYTRLSPNCTKPRNHKIDTITIHCTAGQGTAKQILDLPHFVNKGGNASCNYAVGMDGSIGLGVEEQNRSWCSGGTDKKGQPIRVNGISGKSNDYQAITIEVSSDSKPPYAITDKAMEALIELCADICRRNPGIKRLLWKGDKSLVGCTSKQNMTVHRWFSNKSCPGDYLYNKMGEIAAMANAKLAGSSAAVPVAPVSKVPYTVQVTATDLRIRKGPGTDKAVNGYIEPGSYTIVSEATGEGAALWGKLKSGAGWIALDGVKKI